MKILNNRWLVIFMTGTLLTLTVINLGQNILTESFSYLNINDLISILIGAYVPFVIVGFGIGVASQNNAEFGWSIAKLFAYFFGAMILVGYIIELISI